MKLTINDKNLGQDNYECNVYINGEKIAAEKSKKNVIHCPDTCDVCIEYVNVVLISFVFAGMIIAEFLWWRYVYKVIKRGKRNTGS